MSGGGGRFSGVRMVRGTYPLPNFWKNVVKFIGVKYLVNIKTLKMVNDNYNILQVTIQIREALRFTLYNTV